MKLNQPARDNCLNIGQQSFTWLRPVLKVAYSNK